MSNPPAPMNVEIPAGIDKSARSVFVGNIPYEATEEKLKDIFSEVGPVTSFKLVYDRENGKPKGYGFCEYEDADMASSAMRNLNGYEIGGRSLRVDSACTEKSRMIENSQMMSAPEESPYGEPVHPEKSAETIANVVSSLPPEQMFEVMKQMQNVVRNNPLEARRMLCRNPQLCYALLQIQVVMRVIDPDMATSILHPNPPAPPQFHQMNNQMPPFQQQHNNMPPMGGGPNFGHGGGGGGGYPPHQGPPPMMGGNGDRGGPMMHPDGPPMGHHTMGGHQGDNRSFDRGGSRDRNYHGRRDRDDYYQEDRGYRGGSGYDDPRNRENNRGRDDRSRGGRDDPRRSRDDPRGGRDDPRGGRDDPRGSRDRDDPRSRDRRDRNEGNRREDNIIPPFNAGPSQGSSNPVAAAGMIPGHLANGDPDKAKLIMQVLQLTDEQISVLPTEQRMSILELKKQMNSM